jgi:hypothetical protein
MLGRESNRKIESLTVGSSPSGVMAVLLGTGGLDKTRINETRERHFPAIAVGVFTPVTSNPHH